MKTIRKLISLCLAAAVLLTSGAGVFYAAAAETKVPVTANSSKDVPVILIGGDGDILYDKDGNEIFDIDHPEKLTQDSSDGSVKDAVINVMQPFLLEGVLFNKWDNYYANLEAEIAELTAEVRLDGNGDVPNGSGISLEHRQQVEADKHADRKGDKGYYGFFDYHFWYDWRLDPFEIADQLHDYIEGIKEATGCPKVGIVCRCVGSNVALAYTVKYGTESLQGIGFDGTGSNGGEFISEALSGKFRLDGSAVYRFLVDYTALGSINLSDFALASIDLLVKSGAVDGLTATARATIYNRIVMGATSALALSTLFTMPCYWGFVAPEDYDDAIRYVFGEEGSEKRTQYAGLIAKLDRYHNEVAARIRPLMRGLHEDGVNIGVISKYGFQMFPTCASDDAIADQYASVRRSSFGATTSTVYDTLPDAYVEARIEQGKGEYVSPDRQIDASTCLFPEYTWFTKGARHGNWTYMENAILYTVVTGSRQYSVGDLDAARFMVYHNDTGVMEPMTEENCHTEYWLAEKEEDHPADPFRRAIAFIRSFLNWIKELFAAARQKREG